MVEVVVFPKKCPHCGVVMLKTEKAFYGKPVVFLQCRNDNCSDMVTIQEWTTIGKYRYEYGRKCSKWD